jgi:16S rRNA (cytidine1402-2'-O)-methyltransferase
MSDTKMAKHPCFAFSFIKMSASLVCMTEPGTLFVVATPIGNMEDITLRALRILSEVDYILCEDTRVTGFLLKHHDIKTPLKRYDAHTSDKVHEAVIDDIESGKHIALVSDAGTPGVSDPGVFLVEKLREIGGIRIDAVPGASAVTAAFSIAGLAGNQFSFLGFVPQKKGRQTFFKDLLDYDHPVIFFESPHRIMKALESLKEVLPPETKVVIAREITKLFEELVSGSAEEVLRYFTDNADKVRGEYVVLVDCR